MDNCVQLNRDNITRIDPRSMCAIQRNVILLCSINASACSIAHAAQVFTRSHTGNKIVHVFFKPAWNTIIGQKYDEGTRTKTTICSTEHNIVKNICNSIANYAASSHFVSYRPFLFCICSWQQTIAFLVQSSDSNCLFTRLNAIQEAWHISLNILRSTLYRCDPRS